MGDLTCELSMDYRPINSLYSVPGMQKPIGKISVVGQKQQSGSILIKPANRKNADRKFLYIVRNRAPIVRVMQGGNNAGGFKKREKLRFLRANSLTGNANLIAVGVYFCAERVNDGAVNTYLASLNEYFTLTP